MKKKKSNEESKYSLLIPDIRSVFFPHWFRFEIEAYQSKELSIDFYK